MISTRLVAIKAQGFALLPKYCTASRVVLSHNLYQNQNLTRKP